MNQLQLTRNGQSKAENSTKPVLPWLVYIHQTRSSHPTISKMKFVSFSRPGNKSKTNDQLEIFSIEEKKSFFLLLFFFSSDDKVGEKRFVWLKWCLLFHCEHIFWLGSFSTSESQVSVGYSFFLLQQRCWRNVIRCLNALEKKLINYWKGSF